MRTSKEFSHRTTLLLLCLLITAASACSSLLARASRIPAPAAESKGGFSGKGIQVTEIHPGSLAERGGLQRLDIIFRYGDFEIVDDASYFAARETYQNGRPAGIPLMLWRGGKTLKLTVPPGRLGIESDEYGPVANQLRAVMKRLADQLDIPEFMLDHISRKDFTPWEQILDEAKRLVDQAERESTLTPTQILVARIDMIRDDASPEDLKRQSEMLAQFSATQPLSYVASLGEKFFFEKRHDRAAVECFKRHLKANPDDVSVRLNLGVAYDRLAMFTDADAAVDFVIDNQLNLSAYGYGVACSVKATGMLSHGKYEQSIMLAEKAFELAHCPCDLELTMLAAAQTGNLKKLAETLSKFQQTMPPAEVEQRKLQLDSVEALALVRNHQPARARELTASWKNTEKIESMLKDYWKIYPDGSDIWTNWIELTRN
jgi:tetratricopeptide (TPR) repeat protein